MNARCCLKDCIGTAKHGVVHQGVCWAFCQGHFRYFADYLETLRVARDQLVEEGVPFKMANRIVTARSARDEYPDGGD